MNGKCITSVAVYYVII